MARSATPTSVQRIMRADDFIVSKTDPRGKITYGNRTFIEFSGYTERELLGAPHSIIRHPDMPRAVFKLLWDTIEAGQEFFVYVKNMAKDGSFYWVYANVTADRDPQGRIIGYYSVRRKPKESGVAAVTGLYRAMLEAERRVDRKDAVAAGTRVLTDFLTSQGTSYAELVLAI